MKCLSGPSADPKQAVSPNKAQRAVSCPHTGVRAPSCLNPFTSRSYLTFQFVSCRSWQISLTSPLRWLLPACVHGLSGFRALLYALPCAWKVFIPVKSLLILLGPARVSVTAAPCGSADHIEVVSFYLPLRMSALTNASQTSTWAEALCEKVQGPGEISDGMVVYRNRWEEGRDQLLNQYGLKGLEFVLTQLGIDEVFEQGCGKIRSVL